MRFSVLGISLSDALSVWAGLSAILSSLATSFSPGCWSSVGLLVRFSVLGISFSFCGSFKNISDILYETKSSTLIPSAFNLIFPLNKSLFCLMFKEDRNSSFSINSLIIPKSSVFISSDIFFIFSLINFDNSFILEINFSGSVSIMKPALSWAILNTDLCIVSFNISKLDWSELSIVSAAILKTEIAASKPSWDWALASDIPCNLPSSNPFSCPLRKASCSAFLILSSIKALFCSINCFLFSSSKLFWLSNSFLVSWISLLSVEIFSFCKPSCGCSKSFSIEASELSSFSAFKAMSNSDLFLKDLFSEWFALSALNGACLTVFKILEISAFLKTWGSPVLKSFIFFEFFI